MKKIGAKILALVFLAVAGQASAQSAYDALLATLYKETVPLIHADSLKTRLQRNQPIVLDTRARSEYEVSHLPGARWADYDTFSPEMVKDIAKDRPIVVYCSVGYRSERIGEKLQALGFTDVKNLYGGIFQWKNEGYVVVNKNGQPTDSVHCYSKLWSVWLKEGIKVYD